MKTRSASDVVRLLRCKLPYSIENMVDLVRFELTTSSMPWKRAPNCATGPLFAISNIPQRSKIDTPLARLPTMV